MVEEVYELIKHLRAPKKHKESTYDDLVKLMTGHVNPKPSEMMERNIFYKTHQEADESIGLTLEISILSGIG